MSTCAAPAPPLGSAKPTPRKGGRKCVCLGCGYRWQSRNGHGDPTFIPPRCPRCHEKKTTVDMEADVLHAVEVLEAEERKQQAEARKQQASEDRKLAAEVRKQEVQVYKQRASEERQRKREQAAAEKARQAQARVSQRSAVKKVATTKRPHINCIQCGHQWYPRGSNSPTQCPRCKSDFYNRTPGPPPACTIS
eukprot:m.301483 g.301483  ORF g.301483 m.301483 type:complete len:193 (-) comp14792_c0_seq1:93-671(-)